MIIVLEGPDCAGKTSLARALMRASKGPVKYIHATRPKEQWPYITEILDQAVGYHISSFDVIIDRAWISDNIYSYIDPSAGRAGINVRRQESVLHRYGAYNILCVADPDELISEYKQKLNERDELYGNKFDKMLTVMKLYHDLWTGNVTVQFEGDHPEQYTDQLTRVRPLCRHPLARCYDRFAVIDQQRWARDVWEIAKVETKCFSEADPVRGLPTDEDEVNLSGSLLTCKALLVGDAPGPGDRPLHAPFYSNTGSSAYLTKSLHRSAVPETDVAIVNAYNVDRSVRALEMCLDWLRNYRPRVRVVALGNEAADALDDRGCFDFVKVPHPQWARRFDHHGSYHVKLGAAIYGRPQPHRHGTESAATAGA